MMNPDLSPNGVEKWFTKLANAKEKLTKLHFFFHEVVSGPTPTAAEAARTNVTSSSETFFGIIRVFDDTLTETESPDSKKLGYGQGTYTMASQSDVTILFSFTFVFTDGEYEGSTISVLGSNPIDQKYREMAIVGGSGVFRLARGSAVASTKWRNKKTHDGIVEFTLFVMHYEDDHGGKDDNEDEGLSWWSWWRYMANLR